MELRPDQIIIRPVITEKSTRLRKEFNQYTFEVHPDTNKREVRKAVERLFGVKTVACNIIRRKGKFKRTRLSAGYRPDTKKAVVTLAKGETIKFFEGF